MSDGRSSNGKSLEFSQNIGEMLSQTIRLRCTTRSFQKLILVKSRCSVSIAIKLSDIRSYWTGTLPKLHLIFRITEFGNFQRCRKSFRHFFSSTFEEFFVAVVVSCAAASSSFSCCFCRLRSFERSFEKGLWSAS